MGGDSNIASHLLNRADTNSKEVDMAPKLIPLGKKKTRAVPYTPSVHDPTGGLAKCADFPNPKFVVIKLGRQVTKADTSKGHDTCLVLGNAILLLQDVVDLSMVESKEFKDLMVMQGIQSLQRVGANSEHMKKYSSNLKKANQRANTLVGFNEEEYMNQLAEEENVSIVIVDGTDKREDKGNELGEGDGERAGGGNQDIPSEA
ncbi:hypothetical protein Acr_00g0086220 [Actinidia rufa]|uniref:Uncharacterized protein n=1 Tax=Actinidia rufa TaxID=165716 RepID=A0A7J0DY84_9ERIC|nr:hypothetical protein Acr_00g0086220 [Actinidia rufa]